MTAAICAVVSVLVVTVAFNAGRALDDGQRAVAYAGLGFAALVAAVTPVVWLACRTDRPHPLASIRKEQNR